MSSHLSSGQVLDGYHLVRFIGQGGFGEVWLCRSESMGDYRALKFIPTTHADRFDKEYEALLHYRSAASRLRTPHMVPIEHANRNEAGLYYVMPLADGVEDMDPADPAWQPSSLAARVHAQVGKPAWFASQEIIALIQPVLEALQTLSAAGLVHRDVKPENILFFNGQPCLGDISLLGADASVITRRGTPGYGTPTWYVGGHPDMYGAAATLYTLLTGNSPDKMGRSAFLWPPQGESTLAASERTEWKRLHAVIRRASEEKVSERYVDFNAMAGALCGKTAGPKSHLPRWIVTALVVMGTMAGTIVAAFRAKQPEPKPSSTNVETPKPSEAELTKEEKADYTALAGMIQGYMQDGKFDLALMSVDTLTSTYPQARTQSAYSAVRAMALKGLGRTDEAKEELRKEVNLSPNLAAMDTRKQLWQDLGDLPSAEKDVTRVLDKFGPVTLGLRLRADVRAQRQNFVGVQADREAAIAIHPGDPDQIKVVDSFWSALATKYPGYAAYLKTLQPEVTGAVRSDQAVDAANSPGRIQATPATPPMPSMVSAAPTPPRKIKIVDMGGQFNSVRAKIIDQLGVILASASPPKPVRLDLNAYAKTANIPKAFEQRDYDGALKALDIRLADNQEEAPEPELILFRGFLLKKLGREEEMKREMMKVADKGLESFSSKKTLLMRLKTRVMLWEALDNAAQGANIVSKILDHVLANLSDWRPDTTETLYQLRARMRVLTGDFAGALADEKAALAMPLRFTSASPEQQRPGETEIRARQRFLNTMVMQWELLEQEFPQYADYLEKHGSPEPLPDLRNLDDAD